MRQFLAIQPILLTRQQIVAAFNLDEGTFADFMRLDPEKQPPYISPRNSESRGHLYYPPAFLEWLVAHRSGGNWKPALDAIREKRGLTLLDAGQAA